jgi:hypothetical protein
VKRWEGFVVEEREGQAKPFWHRVATLFEAKNGDGFTLVVPPGVSLSGRVIFREPKERDGQPRRDRVAEGIQRSFDANHAAADAGDDDVPF